MDIVKDKITVSNLCFPLILISLLSLLECITRYSSLSLEEIKLIAIVNYIFSHIRNFEIKFGIF